jgi:carboxypeptidase family protein
MNLSSVQRNIAVMICTLLASFTLRAQNVGSLQGQVTDPTDASVTGATVQLTDLANNATRATKTDATGTFGFAQLNPGTYKLEVSKDGFRTHVEERVNILVATPARVDVRLELGAMSQQVLVESVAVPQLNTQDATVGNTFNENQVKSLPFLARNVVNLLTLQPGVVFTGQSDTDRLSQGSIETLDPREGAVDGVRGNQTNITVDGVDANDWQNQAAFTSALPVTLDSVQEFRVTTTNSNATNGIVGGAQVELVTKSGTDGFHGNLRWYYRTSGTAANDFFNNAQKPQIPRGKDQRNIGGGSIGGPILKDRIFFFLDNEERREIVSATLPFPRQVPSDGLRHGVLVYDCTGSAGCPAASPPVIGADGTSVPIPANAFGLSPAQFKASDPAGLGINQAMLTYMKLLPPGNNPSAATDGGFSFNALSFNTPETTKNNIYTSRLDFLLTKNGHHSVFWRGTLQGLKTDVLPSQFPGQNAAAQLLNNSRGFAVQYQAQFGPTLINTVRWGFTREGVTQSGTSGTTFDVRSFSDIVDFGARTFGRTVPVHNVNDDLSWTHGRHSFQFGGALYLIRNHNINEANSFPAFVVNNGFCVRLCTDYDLSATGANAPAPADPTSFIRAYMMLTGSITQVNATVFATPSGTFLPPGSPEKRNFAENLFEGYFQDSWKVRSNVTLTYGLRYGYETPPWEVNGFQVAPTVDIGQWFKQREINMNMGIPSSASPLLSWGLAGKANHGADSWFRPDYKDFSPRVAMAWSPGYKDGLLASIFGGPGKSSLRLGAGIFYDRIGQALALDSDQNGSPGTATALIDGSTQFTLANAPRFSGTCTSTGCAGLPAVGLPFFPLPSAAKFPFTPLSDTKSLGFGVDPGLRTPYTIHLTASFQRELAKGVVLDVAYVGTLGRRLLGKADFAQYLNIRDPQSKQDLFSAFRQIALIANPKRSGPAGIDPADFSPTGLPSIQAIPFFSNMLPNMPAFAAGFLGDSRYASLTPTQAFYAFTTVDSGVGSGFASWSCALFGLDTFSLPTTNTFGLSSPWNTTVDPTGKGFVLFQPQFSQIGAWTNWANSNYHSLQVSVRKNAGFGTFAFNYVFSKSIDNDSSAENGDLLSPNVSNGTVQGLIQNPFDVGLNRAVSDFNLRHNFNGFVVFDLPFGHGHRWGGSANRVLDAAIGGWEITGAGRWRSGFPQSPGNGFNFPTNFFLTTSGTLTSSLSSSLTRSESASGAATKSQIGTANLFSNVKAVLANLAFTLPGLPGSRNVLTGPAYASLDMGVHKSFRLWREGTRLQFRATVFNAFNSVNFSDSGISLDPTSPATFGQITSTASGRGREMEFAARFEF